MTVSSVVLAAAALSAVSSAGARGLSDPSVQAAFTVSSPVVAGEREPFSVSISDSSAVGVRSVELDVDGSKLSSTAFDGATNPVVAYSPEATSFSTGPHTLTAIATLLDNSTYSFDDQITAVERIAITISGLSRATWNSPIKFQARATANTNPRAGLDLTLQSRPLGSPTWTSHGSATTDSDGAAYLDASTAPTGNASWRAISAANTRQLAAASPYLINRVTARFGRTPSDHNVQPNVVVHYTTSVQPYEPKSVLAIQISEPGQPDRVEYRTFEHAMITADGQVQFGVRVRQAGFYHLCMVRVQTQRIVATTSPQWSLRVT